MYTASKVRWQIYVIQPVKHSSVEIFSLVSLRTQLILRLVRCLPQLLMDIKSVREKRTKFDSMFKLAAWASDLQLPLKVAFYAGSPHGWIIPMTPN